jgi:molybdopterin-guanine dinucleotide biosynthesis protein A
VACSAAMSDLSFASIVLAGGAARRLGGVDKPAIRVGGVPMIERVLAAAAPFGRILIVGSSDAGSSDAGTSDAGTGVATIRESPPGGGPVAAIGAAVDAVGPKLADVVAILGSDLPLLDTAALADLRAIAGRGRADGAVYVDANGRRQWLCGAWRTASVAGQLAALADVRGSLDGAALHELFGALAVAEVAHGDGAPPWFDCDTEDDIRHAEEWLTR